MNILNPSTNDEMMWFLVNIHSIQLIYIMIYIRGVDIFNKYRFILYLNEIVHIRAVQCTLFRFRFVLEILIGFIVVFDHADSNNAALGKCFDNKYDWSD